MKIKINQSKEVNEILGSLAAGALGAIIVLALKSFYGFLTPMLVASDKRLQTADNKIRNGLKELKIPEEAKQDLLQQYDDALRQLKIKSNELQKASGNKDTISKMGDRPSTIIGNEIKKVLVVVQNIIKKYPYTKKSFRGADADLMETYKTISNLDFIVLLASKTEKNSLFTRVIAPADIPALRKIKQKLSDPQELFKFAQALIGTKTKASVLPPFEDNDKEKQSDTEDAEMASAAE